MSSELEKDMYIFGEPIETEIGKIRFLTYKEYLLNIGSVSMMSMNVLHIYYQYKKMFEKQKNEEIEVALEELKTESLFNIVTGSEDFMNAYITIFNLVLVKDEKMDNSERIVQVFEDEELFMSLRKRVMDMNMLTENEVSPNPEIQQGIEWSQESKRDENNKTTSMDIITSIVAGTSNSFEEVGNMTVIQVNSIFYRISAFKNYDTSTLFATVSSDVKIESWSKNFDLYEKEKSSIKKSDFKKAYGDIF